MPFPIVPVIIVGTAGLLAWALSNDKKAGSPSGPLPTDPPPPGSPPETDAEKKAMDALIAKGDDMELWQAARLQYALGRYPEAKRLLDAANSARAAKGKAPLAWPPPVYQPGGPDDVGPQGGPPAPPVAMPPSPPMPTPPSGLPPIPGFPPQIQPSPPVQPPPQSPPQNPPLIPGGGLPGLPGVPLPPGYQIPPDIFGQYLPPPAQPPVQPPPAAPPVSPQLPYKVINGRPIYTVVSGDYGAKIAGKFNRPASEVPLLVKENPQISNWNAVQAGTQLFVPVVWLGGAALPPAIPPPVNVAPPPVSPPIPGYTPPAPPPAGKPLPKGGFRDANGNLKYTIQAGDYGGKIATTWGQPASASTQLPAANPGFNFNTGKAGDVINIPASWALLPRKHNQGKTHVRPCFAPHSPPARDVQGE